MKKLSLTGDPSIRQCTMPVPWARGVLNQAAYLPSRIMEASTVNFTGICNPSLRATMTDAASIPPRLMPCKADPSN